MVETWQFLSRCVKSNLNAAEIAKFDGAVCIYSTNEQVNKYNTQHLEQLDAVVVNVKAVNTREGTKSIPSYKAGNLYNNLLLCISACIILIENL